ncbi:aspartyl-tRNA(Asn)/glutamyl-tRNA(Gln) amidotransferase subunit A [Variovorax sp. CF079]|uniref:amidase n=1 Tax=Variovorax sp. CF079 TaxID=1882774 RepID=UPI00088EDEA3|nr:amidase [Variovorax sp. CF079]SDD50959.1 aspartyl-tRNA(Asn)/glutamyl-tRNA(Gln) amidotransferase subunit A [Variovorax sp. CF079]
MKLASQILAEGFPSLVSMGEMLRTGVCSSVDLTEYALQRIEQLDGRLHAFVGIYAKEALLAAQAADNQIRAGNWLGPLHGIPVALKDNVDVAGRPSTAGSTLLASQVATAHAWITQRLLACGAVIVGKTHMVEFALGAWGANEYMGAPRNPWGGKAHLSPGGSSSGSAVAVAAGMVPLTIGTDTGASVRVPASLCGVTGFKPTIGRLSSEGVVPLSTTLDSVGVLAQTAEDAALMFAALTGDAQAFPPSELQAGASPSLRGLRVGYLGSADLEGLQPEIHRAYAHALDTFREQGAHLQQLVLPTTFDELADVSSTIMLSEAAASWGHLAADESLRMDASVRPRILAGARLSATKYVAACRRRAELKRLFAPSLGDLDVFLTPTSQWTARPLESVDHTNPPVRYARIGNLLDLCGISVQMGEDDQSLPIGLQIAGRTDAEARVLGVARGYQACTSWHQRRWTADTSGR